MASFRIIVFPVIQRHQTDKIPDGTIPGFRTGVDIQILGAVQIGIDREYRTGRCFHGVQPNDEESVIRLVFADHDIGLSSDLDGCQGSFIQKSDFADFQKIVFGEKIRQLLWKVFPQ